MRLTLLVQRHQDTAVDGPRKVFDNRGGSIGRKDENYWTLPDPGRVLSSKHAFILHRDDEYYVVDTSQNGVFINEDSEPVGWCRTVLLHHGDRLRMGPYEAAVLIDDGAGQSDGAANETSNEFAATVSDAAPPASPPSAEELGLEDPGVLVVEDEEDISYLLKFMLERNGRKVTVAGDGLSAKKVIDTMAPAELVVLDIMLPHFDGFKIVELIKANQHWENVPIVMLSAMSSERDIVRALAAGANDYVVKPFKPAELSARLSRFLRASS